MVHLKKILPLILLTAFLLPLTAEAAGGGPNTFGYTWSDEIDYNWIDTSTGTVLALSNNDYAANLPFGFTFNFYAYDKTEFIVSSNGLVGLGNTINIDEYSNQCPFNATSPNNIIAVYWDYLSVSSGGTIRYYSAGTDPYRYTVVEWNQVPNYGTTDTITAQAIFIESANWIILNYQSASSEQGLGSTIGIKSPIGWDNLLLGCNTQGTVTDSYAVWIGMDGPKNISADAQNGAVHLSWNDENLGHEGTSIERAKAEAGPFEEIDEATGDALEYDDTDAAECNEYWYRLRLRADTFYGPYTEPVDSIFPPYGPTDLVVTDVSTLQNLLTWKDNSYCETGYEVERTTTSKAPWNTIATLDADSESYLDESVVAGMTYIYRVRAITDTLESAYSEEAGVTVVLNPPQNPAATAYSWEEIDLTWEDTSEDETGFAVERKAPGEDEFTEIASVGPDALTYRDFGLEPEAEYTYRIRSFALQAYSEYSDEVSATTLQEGEYAEDDDDDNDVDDDDDDTTDDDSTDDDSSDDDDDDDEGCCG